MSVLRYNVRDGFADIAQKDPNLSRVLSNLQTEGRIYLLGGAVRDIGYLGKQPRDLDIVVDSTNIDLDIYFSGCKVKKNSFGGYKVLFDGIEADIWTIAAMHILKEDNLPLRIESVLKAPLLSTDAILCDLQNGEVLDTGFSKSVLANEITWWRNPNSHKDVLQNVLRALITAKKYSISISSEITNVLGDNVSTEDKFSLLESYFNAHYRGYIEKEEILDCLERYT